MRITTAGRDYSGRTDLHTGVNAGSPLFTDGEPYLVRGRSRQTGHIIEICVLSATDEVSAMKRAMTTYRDAGGRLHLSPLLSAEYARAIPTPDSRMPRRPSIRPVPIEQQDEDYWEFEL